MLMFPGIHLTPLGCDYWIVSDDFVMVKPSLPPGKKDDGPEKKKLTTSENMYIILENKVKTYQPCHGKQWNLESQPKYMT